MSVVALAFAFAALSAAQDTPRPEPKTINEAARIEFGPAPSARDLAFSAQTVDTADVIALVDACMRLSPQKPEFWPTLKAEGWLFESGQDKPADYAWDGTFIKAGLRGQLVEHIWQADILHCEARGETGSAERRAAIWKAIVAHYGAVPAADFKGENPFIKNVREEMPQALRKLFVTAQNMIFSHSDEREDSTVISVDVF